MSQPRIFVSHSHKDEDFTERLVADLRQAGANAWMDDTDLGAGNFQQRISDALAGCDWFVLVLTRDALASQWVRQEVDAANRLKNQGQIHDLIFLQSGPLEHRELPALWGVFNIFDATQSYTSARDRTLKAVGLLVQASAMPADRFPNRLADLGFTTHSDKGIEYILPPLCTVPAGPFLMGSNPKRDKESYPAEQPQHTVTLPAYEIARFPITVAEYACFVRAGQREPNDWQWQLGEVDYPVVNVTWHDAVAYAQWLVGITKENWRLPTEAEWEKAARGTDGRIYPWGDTFDMARCNTLDNGIRATTPIGSYPSGASPYRVQDMAGNVDEWTSSLRRSYPYNTADGREDVNSTDNRAFRGGSWGNNAKRARTACRSDAQPYFFGRYYGFRVVRASPTS